MTAGKDKGSVTDVLLPSSSLVKRLANRLTGDLDLSVSKSGHP